MIANDIVRAVESGRCPLLLTGRTEHLQYFAAKLAGVAKHVFVLKGGMGKKQRRETAAALAAVPENESRVILATGSYIGEGFDDARLDTLFLAMPISWKGTLQQYVGRLHRLHDNKRFVQVYDYVDSYVLMLARMYERRLKGYAAIGYVIEQEPFHPILRWRSARSSPCLNPIFAVMQTWLSVGLHRTATTHCGRAFDELGTSENRPKSAFWSRSYFRHGLLDRPPRAVGFACPAPSKNPPLARTSKRTLVLLAFSMP